MAAAGHQIAFHALLFVVFFFSTYYDHFHVHTKRHLRFGKFVFLTFWNAILQTLYYGYCVVSDVYAKGRKGGRLQRWRDNFHASIAFPVGTFVVVSFWTIYAIDRELVFPRILDDVVPQWLNHMLHTAVLPFLLVDKMLVQHRYPKRFMGILGACGLAMLYIVWILFIAYYENFWVYPILAVLNMYQRAGFIAVCWLVFAALYVLGESLTKFIWAKDTPQPRTVSSKRQSKSKRH